MRRAYLSTKLDGGAAASRHPGRPRPRWPRCVLFLRAGRTRRTTAAQKQSESGAVQAVACHGERSLVHRSPSRAVVTGYPGGAVH